MKIAALLLAAISFVPSSGVRSFVHDYLVSRHGELEKGSMLATASVANGIVLAYVFGDGWCGAAGGCALLILKSSGSSYRVIGSRLGVQLPVYVLNSATHGEPELGLIRAGTGRPYHRGLWYPETIVSFDGRSYGGIDKIDPELKLGELKGRKAFFGSKNGQIGTPL